jgi:hypothetical protein
MPKIGVLRLQHACMQQFKAQKGRPRRDLPTLVQRLGLEQGTLNQQWSQLSVKYSANYTSSALACVCSLPDACLPKRVVLSASGHATELLEELPLHPCL